MKETWVIEFDTSLLHLDESFENTHQHEPWDIYNEHLKEALKNQVQDLFYGPVQDFAAKHPGEITVGDMNQDNYTLRIDAEPSLVEELREIPGIRAVDNKEVFIVEYAYPPDTKAVAGNREAVIKLHKDAQQVFHNAIEGFSKSHPGEISILQEAWLNNTMKIKAKPSAIEELKKVAGVGRIDKPGSIQPE